MGWDMLVMKLDRPIGSTDDWPDDYSPPAIGSADEVRNAISGSFPQTDWSDPLWGICDAEGFALEFSLGEAQPVDSFAVHVHGSGDPVRPLLGMCAAQGWTALDVQTTELLDPAAPDRSSWHRFCEWRDRIIEEGDAAAEQADEPDKARGG